MQEMMRRQVLRNRLLGVTLFILSAQSSAAFRTMKTSVVKDRNAFNASAFAFDLRQATQIKEIPGVYVQFADVSTFPILGLPDTQMSVVRIFYGDGVVFPTHVHPRGTEMLYVVNGSLKVTLEAEFGSTGRTVNTLNPGQVTIFPIGLAHGQVCVSGPCEAVAMLDSPDPSIYFVKL
jgi:quercetin dioxygenase-like cupin family protein